jgi:hypothetical protein
LDKKFKNNKTMKLIKLFGLYTIFIGLIACSQSTQKSVEEDVPTGWRTINESGYIIQYPDSFELNNSGQTGTDFILFSKQTSMKDLFRENVNLIIQDLGGQNIDLDRYVQISEEQIKTLISNANIIESIRIENDNSEFQKIIYSGDMGQYHLQFEQHYRVAKGKAYVLTLTCELIQFKNYREVGEKIMNSFMLK